MALKVTIVERLHEHGENKKYYMRERLVNIYNKNQTKNSQITRYKTVNKNKIMKIYSELLINILKKKTKNKSIDIRWYENNTW